MVVKQLLIQCVQDLEVWFDGVQLGIEVFFKDYGFDLELEVWELNQVVVEFFGFFQFFYIFVIVLNEFDLLNNGENL